MYAGGYHLLDEPIVRSTGVHGHTAKDLSKLSETTVSALNLIQDTPWAVNGFILETVLSLRGVGLNVGFEGRQGFQNVMVLEEPVNPRLIPENPVNLKYPPEVWEGFTRQQRQLVKQASAKEHNRYKEQFGTYLATKRIIDLAVEMSEHDRFYFPHNMDFRTRIYPIPTGLTPQSDDLSKGLLRFYRPTRIGAAGHYWMGVMTASHFGKDKLSMDDRFRYASDPEFFGECCLYVDAPLEYRGWLKADSPFQFLAMAFEWVWANRQADPYSYMSYLPGNLDGSCNGAQHLSIMARDAVGAKATNCTSDGERNDLYMQVADTVLDRVLLDVSNGHPEAIAWLPKLEHPADRRDCVKRAVMTVPYGVTGYGVAQFMIKDGHVDKADWAGAKYMRDLILQSIDLTLDKGRALQRYFQECALIVANEGLPLAWDTPAGSKVTQAYRNIIEKRIQGYKTKFTIFLEPDEDEDGESFLKRVGMDADKMATSAPPNVVHSCDASHLQITTVRMGQIGIKDFSMIHDSFGCPLAYVGLMRDITRHAAVDMYSGDYVRTWKESVERYSGLVMPEPPALGTFDVNEILGSEYFFS